MADLEKIQSESVRFSAEILRLSDLNNRSFEIPSYQRPYCWEKEEVDCFIDDLIDSWQHSRRSRTNSDAYSLGTIVTQQRWDASGQPYFDVLDGQQRLTTVDLLLKKINEKISTTETPPLIRAYRYLENSSQGLTEHRRPPMKEQADWIGKKIENIENISGSTGLGDFRQYVLGETEVQLVVIPLASIEKIRNEASCMFEIINMRGQKLNELDILKARLIGILDENRPEQSALFDELWVNAGTILKERILTGFDAEQAEKVWTESVNVAKNGGADAVKTQNWESFNDILENREEGTVEQGTAQDGDSGNNNETESFSVPTTFIDLLKISAELLRFYESGDSETDYHALTDSALQIHFDDLFFSVPVSVPVEEYAVRIEKCRKNVWQLWAVLSTAIRTVCNWGPYRRLPGYEFADIKTPFNQLIMTFYAAGGYRSQGQYWMLVLIKHVLDEILVQHGHLPDSPESLFEWLKTEPDWKKLQKSAYQLLINWAYHTLTVKFDKGDLIRTRAVFDFFRLNQKLNQGVAAEAEQVGQEAVGWTYGNGQWRLYFLDWVVWTDIHTDKEKLQLEKVMDAVGPELTEQKLTTEFSREEFVERGKKGEIINRGAIEHWLSQGNVSDEEREERQYLGNLALVDASLNSTMRDKAVQDKVNDVLGSSNPSLKLLWLALFTKANPEFCCGRQSRYLSEVWAKYLESFDFTNSLKEADC